MLNRKKYKTIKLPLHKFILMCLCAENLSTKPCLAGIVNIFMGIRMYNKIEVEFLRFQDSAADNRRKKEIIFFHRMKTHIT